jgi:predicted transcriptional regulator
MTIVLTPQTEEQLCEKAEREGQDVNEVADALIQMALEWEAQERAEAAEGIRRGLEDFEAGRFSTAAEAFADIKARHVIGD